MQSQEENKNLNARINLPIGEMIIDEVERQVSSSTSVADSATTNIKKDVATNEEDFSFIKAKQDNYILLVFTLYLPHGYKYDNQVELTLGFQMQTKSEIYKQDPF